MYKRSREDDDMPYMSSSSYNPPNYNYDKRRREIEELERSVRSKVELVNDIPSQLQQYRDTHSLRKWLADQKKLAEQQKGGRSYRKRKSYKKQSSKRQSYKKRKSSRRSRRSRH
jgi:hypothetical protein